MLYDTRSQSRGGPVPEHRGPDPDLRRTRVVSEGRAIEYVHRATGTARLLQSRTSGPVFLADRRVPTSGRRASAAADVCPVTGPRTAVLPPRAERPFKSASTHRPHGQVVVSEPTWQRKPTVADRRGLSGPSSGPHINLYGRFEIDTTSRLGLSSLPVRRTGQLMSPGSVLG